MDLTQRDNHPKKNAGTTHALCMHAKVIQSATLARLAPCLGLGSNFTDHVNANDYTGLTNHMLA